MPAEDPALTAHAAAVQRIAASTSSKWTSIAAMQAASRREPARDRGPPVQRVLFRAPSEPDTVTTLQSALAALNPDRGAVPAAALAPVDVPAEWVFGSEDVAAAVDAPTVFYVHGGNYHFSSPAMVRPFTRRIAAAAGGRLLAVQYRWSTDAAFPNPLLDLFVAYLSLTAQLLDERKTTTTTSSGIVLAGESSGGGMALALLQLLLHVRRTHPTPSIAFNGRRIPVLLPAGTAVLSAVVDATRSCPSWDDPSPRFDWVQHPCPLYTPAWTPEPAWPASPPRADIYCERGALAHPLVSPLGAASWAGAPPLWLAVGQELDRDSSVLLAAYARADGAPVRLEAWAAMPHIWPWVLPRAPQSGAVLESWGRACRALSERALGPGGDVVVPFGGDERAEGVRPTRAMGRDEVRRRMRARRDERPTLRPEDLKPPSRL